MLLALSINTPLGYPPGLANTAAQGLAGPKCGPVHPHAKLAKLAVKVLTAVLNPPALQIIPIENIQGRKAVEAGDLCMRKTAAGVDLNRNWAHAWTAVRTPLRASKELSAAACTWVHWRSTEQDGWGFLGRNKRAVCFGAGQVTTVCNWSLWRCGGNPVGSCIRIRTVA